MKRGKQRLIKTTIQGECDEKTRTNARKENAMIYNKQINLIYFKEYNLYKLLKFYFKSK